MFYVILLFAIDRSMPKAIGQSYRLTVVSLCILLALACNFVLLTERVIMNAEKLKQLEAQVRIGGKVCSVMMLFYILQFSVMFCEILK